jgi:hypothetical protein
VSSCERKKEKKSDVSASVAVVVQGEFIDTRGIGRNENAQFMMRGQECGPEKCTEREKNAFLDGNGFGTHRESKQ